MTPPHPRVGVSVLVFRDAGGGEVLLVQRGKEPARGLWAPPGGSLEWGETVAEAAAREVWEETGLRVAVPEDAAFTVVDAIARSDDGAPTFHYVLVEVLALRADDGQPLAASDAADCRWWPVAALHEAQPQVAALAHVVALAQRRLREIVTADNNLSS